jgi:hypothetical protein
MPLFSREQRAATTAVAKPLFPQVRTHHIVDAALQSPAQPLEPKARSFFENRFGFDFGQVRIHTGQAAARSVQTIGARAFAIGKDLVFGQGEYHPDTRSGRFLLAHELAHVIQQYPSTTDCPAPCGIGNLSDQTEREADIAARVALSTAGSERPLLHTAPAGSRPVLRRYVDTWGGRFDTDYFNETSDRSGPGVDIKIRFTPNDTVDATKIALTQWAQTLRDGKPVSPYEGQIHPVKGGVETGKEVAEKRRLPETDTDAPGAGIDSTPSERTPLMQMRDPPSGDNEMAHSVPLTNPGQEAQFGSRTKGAKPTDAFAADRPRATSLSGAKVSQSFETAALALEGKQKGVYYGSVKWGWDKEAGSTKVTKRELRPAVGPSVNLPGKDNFSTKALAPSTTFFDTVALWNQSKTMLGAQSFPLPSFEAQYVKLEKSPLLARPDERKTLGDLKLNTQLGVTDQTDPAHPDWRKVVVVTGDLRGTVGWLKKDALSHRETETKGKR